ncbi:Glutathione S-transferase [Mycena chlorophos]|uniref:glutathione transferase n=1 Tax=Mycena chlorophos TaxID=658473 RepID=A0A8H6S6W3_MYCCL|nr:Glutathione S-transferase [Mycena chlorophos]
MVLKLHAANRVGGGGSVVAMVLSAKRIPFTFISTPIQPKTPGLLAMQPFGKVPIIVQEDGFRLYESRAICMYLQKKYPDQGIDLGPADASDLRAQALFDQGLFIEATNFHPAVYRLIEEIIFKPFSGRGQDRQMLAELLHNFDSVLDAYEMVLAKQKYIGGDKLTIVDYFHLAHAPLLARICGIHIMTKPERPNVCRWWKEVVNLPQYRELLEQDGLASRKSYP